MSDIEELCQSLRETAYDNWELCTDAAVEIERLQAAIERLQAAIKVVGDAHTETRNIALEEAAQVAMYADTVNVCVEKIRALKDLSVKGNRYSGAER